MLLPHLKLQYKKAYFRGKWHAAPRGMPFERKLEGHIWNDNGFGAHKISLFVRLRTFVERNYRDIYGQ